MYLDPAGDKATARRTVMVAAPGKDTENVEEHLPSGHAWKNSMPAVWPSKVGVSSKVKRGNAGGQKGDIRTEKHGQFGEALLDVRNRENYIPVRVKEERKKQMERWGSRARKGVRTRGKALSIQYLVMELNTQKKKEKGKEN